MVLKNNNNSSSTSAPLTLTKPTHTNTQKKQVYFQYQIKHVTYHQQNIKDLCEIKSQGKKATGLRKKTQLNEKRNTACEKIS